MLKGQEHGLEEAWLVTDDSRKGVVKEGQVLSILLVHHEYHIRRDHACSASGLDEGEQCGRKVIADHQLALPDIQALLCHRCGDQAVEVPGSEPPQDLAL